MNDALHRQLGLTDSEYDDIVSILGRGPARVLVQRVASRQRGAPQLALGGNDADVGKSRVGRGKVRSHAGRWSARSRVPYESRWAPYVRVHGPGQGQFPKGSIRPRGYMAPDARRSFAGLI